MCVGIIRPKLRALAGGLLSGRRAQLRLRGFRKSGDSWLMTTLPAANHRVASLLPSATEIVCALGAEVELVGISHECDFPESVRHLPALTRARLRPVRSSREIDRDVRAVLQDALAVYEIDWSASRRPGPT